MNLKNILRGILRWGGRILLGVLGLFVGLIIFLLIREAITRRKLEAEYPPPGQMVSLGTHDIHLNCVGSGSPTVVFEADLDQYGSLSWNSVQGEVGEFTRACSYDRAGILWSEPGPRPRDGETIATELEATLEAAGEEGPYILVGHAFGGAYVRIFAGQYPDDVCGMVLAESSHPEMLTRFAEVGLDHEIPDKAIRPLISFMTHLGIPDRERGNIYDLPPEINDPVEAFFPESSLAWYDEKAESPTTLAQAGQYTYLGDFPLIVIATALPPTSLDDQALVLQELWLELEQDLLSLSGDSEYREYESGHYPQLQDPEIIIEAIQDVFTRCKETSF